MRRGFEVREELKGRYAVRGSPPAVISRTWPMFCISPIREQTTS